MAMLLLAGSIQGVCAQKAEKKGIFLENKSLYEELADIQKKTDKFNLYLDMQGSFDANSRDGFGEGIFRIRQLHIGVRGNLNGWLSYRYRQRLNRLNEEGGIIDDIPTSIDYTGINVRLNDQFSFFAGRQCVAYEGFEFDLNPIDICEYSDMIDNMSNFMTELNIGYNITPTQQLNLQILNSHNSSFDRVYGITEDSEGRLPDLKSGKVPLVYTLNWGGNFSEVFKTRWSASAISEAKSRSLYYYAIGNELNLDKFNMLVDFTYSQKDIDRNGTIIGVVGNASGYNAFNTGYLSIVTKLNYRLLPEWSAFVKGMYETASVTRAAGGTEKGNYCTSQGYLAGVGFYPMETNLCSFLTYVGCSYNFTHYTKMLGQENYSTNRLSLGFTYQLPMF